MLRIDRQSRALRRLANPSMPGLGLMERYDLQQMIKNSPDAFFAEMGETLLLVAEEVRPAEFVEDRIDLLAIDPQGNTVIIELKRGAHKLQLLQALTYAAMVSHWNRDRLATERKNLTNKPVEEVEEELQEFLLSGTGELNEAQRIMLLAEDFEYEVLVTAEWLAEQYEVDVRCYRLTVSTDEDAEYLSCIGVYPPPEITQHAVRRGRARRTDRPTQFADWDAALEEVDQPVADFFRRALAASQQSYLPKRIVSYRIGDRRLFDVAARRRNAYVWQKGRFANDVQFWAGRLSQPESVAPVASGNRLRFYLNTLEDFEAFRRAVDMELLHIDFANVVESAPELPDD